MNDTDTVTVAMLRRFGEAMRDGSIDNWTVARGLVNRACVDAALATLPASEPQPALCACGEDDAEWDHSPHGCYHRSISAQPAPAAQPQACPSCGHGYHPTARCTDGDCWCAVRSATAQPQAALPVLEAVAYNTSLGLIPATGIQTPHPSIADSALCFLSHAQAWQAEAEKLREAVEWQSGCTKALLPYQERAVTAESECQRLAAENARLRERDEAAKREVVSLRARIENLCGQLTRKDTRIAELEAQVAAARAEERERVAKMLQRTVWQTAAAAVRAMGDA